MPADRTAHGNAGGDVARLARAERIADVAAFTDGQDRIAAGIHPERPTIGTLWDWTGDAAVLARAEAWLRERGAKVARGPMEVCSWFEHRAPVGPFDDLPFAFEPTAPAEPWVAAGFRVAAHSAAALVDHDVMIAAAGERAGALATAGWSVQPLPLDLGEGRASEAQFREAVATLHAIASQSVAESWGYAPIPVEALQEALAPRRTTMDPRLVLIARAPDGSPAGVLFAVPDFCDPRRGWFVVNTLAVLPKYRQYGVGAWLVAAAHKAARKAGYKAGVHWLADQVTAPGAAAELATGRGWNVERHGGRLIRRYAVFERAI